MVCENPFVTVGINLWNGLCGNGVIIRPLIFELNVNGQAILLLINQDAVLQFQLHFKQQETGVFRHLWWAQDGAPAHRLIAVRNRLQELFGDRVIALNHAVKYF
jgi:hypothetical protein